ncbi:MAG TPA: type II toxin-antitoxin system PemK/MazF family toxin [Pirellulales bacterium]|nr:type II toxin-antitoxin system PemK/MazF family toxin [Pirellulales bacterium]
MSPIGNIQLGTIVLVVVRDPDTRATLEPHPAVVLNCSTEIEAGSDLRVAVCTTSFRGLQSGWFELPASPGGHKQTGLDQACVVKATWIERVPQAEVLRVFGRAPARIFKQILNWLEDKDRDEKRRRGESGA